MLNPHQRGDERGARAIDAPSEPDADLPHGGREASRFRMVATVHLVLQRGDQILMLRRWQTGWADGCYSLPAGHVDGGEPVRAAAAREAYEECGVTIPAAPGGLSLMGVMHRRSDREQMDFFFRAQAWSGEPYNREPEKCDHLGWFPRHSLPPNTVSYVRRALWEPSAAPWLLEYGWEG